jgi:hypothetical protein
MKRKSNGKAGPPDMRPRKSGRPGAGDDPGFTATQGSSSEAAPDRESGLKQAGLSDEGGTGPRRKPGGGRN